MWDPTFFSHAKFEVKNFFVHFFGGGGSSSLSTHAFHIHTHAIQIRIVALCVSKSATKKNEIIKTTRIPPPPLPKRFAMCNFYADTKLTGKS